VATVGVSTGAEKCQSKTEKCQFRTEKCQFRTEKCQFRTVASLSRTSGTATLCHERRLSMDRRLSAGTLTSAAGGALSPLRALILAGGGFLYGDGWPRGGGCDTQQGIAPPSQLAITQVNPSHSHRLLLTFPTGTQ
jgi:hypothetical protein